jgi:hypothetical protein
MDATEPASHAPATRITALEHPITALTPSLAIASHAFAGVPLWIAVASCVLSALWVLFSRGARHALEWNETLKTIRETWRSPP